MPFSTRRDLLKAAAVSAGAAPFINRLGAATRQPNILLLMTDQQSAEAMSCRLGRRYLHTPAMDSLAASGMLFSRAYCANPLCVPSRTSMFTGRYPSETGLQTNEMVRLDPQRFPTMGSVFRRAGYEAAYAGKWHLPYPERDPATHGFNVLRRNTPRGDGGICAAAADFLRTNRREPFLLVASFVNPHNICQWARGEALPDGEIGDPPPADRCPPLRPNHEPQRDEPDGVTLMRKSYQAAPMFPVGDFDAAKWRQYIWAYYRMVEKVDALLGRVLASLRESGREENTLVVFLADHGDCQGAHRWNQKTILYDEAARVPLIISHRGVTRSGISDRLVHTGVDLIPTLCGYAGIPSPPDLPGSNLCETVHGKGGKDPREYVVVSNRMVQGAAVNGRTPVMEGRMLQGRRYKYCVYSEGRLRESLVDMEKDPGEMRNLAGDSAYRQILQRHREMLRGSFARTKDPFRI